MNMRLATGFALKNIKANRYLEIPFIASTGVMMILFTIMVSLLQNKFVQTRHPSLLTMVSFGTIISGIFTFIFVIYANRFLLRKRNKEFALYGILGLEKKHIRKILFIEHSMNYGVIAFFSILGGQVFGKLTFLGLTKLLRDVKGRVTDYSFSMNTVLITLAYVMFLFVSVYLLNLFAIKNSSPIELLSKDKKGEGEPKSRGFLLLLGILLLVGGYGLALVIEGTLKSLAYFFLAVLLVLFATYVLFVSLSIFVLKVQKKNKTFYYKDRNFLSVSGMLYRMKSGAVGLASMAILSTGVIITLAATLTIYMNIENVVENSMSRDYEVGYYKDFSREGIEPAREKLMRVLKESLGGDIRNVYSKVWTMVPVVKEGEKLIPAKKENLKNGQVLYVYFQTAASYNQEFGKDVKLEKDEIIVSANSKSLLKRMDFILNEKKHSGRIIENILPANIGIEAYLMVVADEEKLSEMAAYYKILDFKKNHYENARLNVSVGFDSDVTEVEEKIYGWNMEENFDVNSRNRMREDFYELNGGFLFLGIIVGIIFLAGTILITYYKQVSEGIEDREKYDVMRKVGLPESLIKQTANSQIIWMFFLPLLVAMLHSFIASKIVYQLLGLFGVHKYLQYGSNLFLVSLVFGVIYFINFKVTSGVYYRYVR